MIDHVTSSRASHTPNKTKGHQMYSVAYTLYKSRQKEKRSIYIWILEGSASSVGSTYGGGTSSATMSATLLASTNSVLGSAILTQFRYIPDSGLFPFPSYVRISYGLLDYGLRCFPFVICLFPYVCFICLLCLIFARATSMLLNSSPCTIFVRTPHASRSYICILIL
jgi:hypothetical protein